MKSNRTRAAKRAAWSFIERQLVTHQPIGRQIAERVLHSRNLVAAAPTDPALLMALLAELHPIAIDVPLVRIGPAADGGYLVPDDLAGLAACFSPGVADQSGFELDCAERGMDVFMADGSVDAPSLEHRRFHFTKRFLGNVDDGDVMTMDRWVADSIGDTNGDLLLQMDIEGAEWQVLPAMSDTVLRRFRIIVVELHDLQHLHLQAGFAHLAPILRRLLHTHACVHIHPNNAAPQPAVQAGIEVPSIVELTFLRRDRVRQTGYAHDFPHPLDADNIVGPTLVLPPSLHRSIDGH